MASAGPMVSMSPKSDRNADSPVPLDTIPISPAKENVDPSSGISKTPNGAAKSGDEQITVFHDKENFNVKHPLMHEWTLWFTKPPSGKVRPMPPNLKFRLTMISSGR